MRSLASIRTGECVNYESMKSVMICWSETFGFFHAFGFDCVKL
ncbi:MAG: hypothetical protein NZ526_05485 [Aquificaceae bacterium]|nr:hypothetical protein [Aquificaceae bacterium]